MNQTFKRINEERVLFFDLEVARKSKELEVDSKEFELYQKKIRNKETEELLPDLEVVEEYRKKAALKMGYTKIVSIGVGFIKGEELHIKALEGTEEELIQQFCKIANSFDYVCGVNILGYDLPITVNNGMKYFDMTEILSDRFITSGKKPWNLDRVLDLMDIFKGTHYSNSSLDELCFHFGIESPKSDLDGSKVSEEYWTNGVVKINKYVKQDVFASANLFKKMRFEKVFEDFIDKSGNDNFEIKKNAISKLYDNTNFPKELKEEFIKSLVNLTDEDRENSKKIILAHYQKKGDRAAVKKEKEKEVNDFINSI
jgi:predicted PolB exonuclease-like 3'-5' exonuclease|nr:MAG TPA: DNA polymerase B [Caudoviricetes sp.]